MSETSSNRQSAYHQARIERTSDVEQDIYEAMRHYLVADLGRAEEMASQRARSELDRHIPRTVLDDLSARGIPIRDATVLDLGAGLGGMSEELVLRGANVLALEPGSAWADIARRRAGRHGGKFRMMEAFGEAIPLEDSSVDLIVSWRVLEHVRDPARVLQEAWRVLRPGGRFYLSCENYLAFWEAHYDVPWLPLLPKPVGATYLRLLGRSPEFLEQSVTYTTYPGVLRTCRAIGFVRARDLEVTANLNLKRGAKWRVLKAVAALTGGAGPLILDRATRTFTFGLHELFEKPRGPTN